MMSNQPLNYNPALLRYTGVIGTGGIGSGKFFRLNGDRTLTREESRSGHFMDVRDYCKQHIILHYIKILLGADFPVIPVGKVGDDVIGDQLISEMTSTGFLMDYVEKVAYVSTLLSFCFYYPDGTGGNLTTDNSASSLLNDNDIEKVLGEIKKLNAKGMIMAAPEVPLQARQKLLQYGKENGLFCTASFTSGEIRQAAEDLIFPMVDFIAINLDEATTLTGFSPENSNTDSVIAEAIQKLISYNPQIQLSITSGKEGSWCWDGIELYTFPAIKTEVKSTAGAGDAFFSGMIAGIALGLKLQEAQQLATLVAGYSVGSTHTIHPDLDRNTLNQFRMKSNIPFSDSIVKLLVNT
jgi:sugar/nucleoside kinase (ribokinase family)